MEAVTVSTYRVGFSSFLAEYFTRHSFHPMFTGFRSESHPLPDGRGSETRYRAATVREWVAGTAEPFGSGSAGLGSGLNARNAQLVSNAGDAFDFLGDL